MEGRLGKLNIPSFESLARLKRNSTAIKSSATLPDRLRKKPSRERRSHLRTHRERARRLTKDRHVLRITTERSNVLLHPLQRRRLIHQTVVPRSMMHRLCRQLRMNKKSEDTQPIVHRHNNHIAM